MTSVICYFPGAFAPPTRYHFETVFWLATRKEFSSVKIIVGKDGDLTPAEKAALWKLLLSVGTFNNVSVQQTEDTALNQVYKILEKEPAQHCFIAIDEKSGRKEEFMNHFEKFPNQQIELIPSQFYQSSQDMLKAIAEDDTTEIRLLLPNELSKAQVEEYRQILQKAPKGEEQEDLKERVTSMLGEKFWKDELRLNENNSLEDTKIKRNGKPLLVYRSQDDDRQQGAERQSKHYGIYFSEDKESTKKYGNNTKTYYLNIKNPMVLKDKEWNLSVLPEHLYKHLISKGYDGAVWIKNHIYYEIIAFDKEQVIPAS